MDQILWAARKTLSLGLQVGQETSRSQTNRGSLQEDREEWGDGTVPAKRGERWLILDHAKAGGKRRRAMKNPGSCGSLSEQQGMAQWILTVLSSKYLCSAPAMP